MAYANLMVAMTLGRSNGEVLAAARELAQRLRAGVVGVAAYRPIQAVCADLPAPAKLFDEDRKQCARQSTEAEAEFRALLAGSVDRLEWRERSTLGPLADQLAREARSADLVLVGAAPEPADGSRFPDIRDLVMDSGKPVLIVPAKPAQGIARRVLVGWKDTRETHRAIVDAVPLLQVAEEVVLAGIAPAAELGEMNRQMTEVGAWLERHGVKARLMALPAQGANASQFARLADDLDAGLMVIGAYGHLRQSQWVFGGITAEILQHPKRPALLSH